jgi:TRAP-type C4-dicarboxylate transport system substrate-binding protein
MKEKGLIILAGIVCLMFMFSTSPVDKACAQEKVITLKVANYFPPPSKQSKITEEFGAELESRSGGRIKVQFFGGGSLLKAPAMFKGVETGIADIGYSHVYYTPGRMPVSELIGLPGTPPAGSMPIWDTTSTRNIDQRNSAMSKCSPFTATPRV